MNNQNRRKSEKSAQMRTIYVTLALALVVMTVLVALSSSWRKAVDETPGASDTEAIATLPNEQVMAPHTSAESDMTETEAAATTAEATETDAAATEESSAKPSSAEPALPEFVAPVGGHLMKSHSGDVPVFSVTMNDYRPHTGVDLSASIGDDVFAAAAGMVKEIWEDPMSGNCISIVHDGGAVTVYRNLAPTVPDSITVGAAVSAGQVIGSVGESSLLEIADEPHIHFELSVDGEVVDPAEYIAFPTADTGYEG